MPVESSLKHARESRMPSFGGLFPVTEIAGSRGALMANVIVYSFKGYDTAKHRHALRLAKATLERIRRIDDAVAVAGRAMNCRGRWLTVMGFGAQAPNKGRDADGSRADDASLAHSLPSRACIGVHVGD